MSDLIIIGIGNPMRGDDGVGWAVIDLLKQNTQIPLQKQRGDIADLMEAFEHYSTVYLVDACTLNAPAGSWRRIDGIHDSLPEEHTQTSTHGFGITQAIGMAKNLNLLPSKLIIYAICGHDYEMNNTLSPSVEAAIEKVARELLNEEDIHARTKLNG